MNKLTLIFTVLRVYSQARGKEGSTIRGAIIGTLAAVAIVGLWFMGAEMNAEQIGLVVSAAYGIDTVLKIVIPDKIGTELPSLEMVGRSQGYNDATPENEHSATEDRVSDQPGADVAFETPVVRRADSCFECSGVAADRVRQSVPSNRDPGADTQSNRWESGGFGDK